MGSSFSAPAAPGLRQRQKLQREQRIMSAARKLFDRRGYAGTSMEDVAARAGLAVGTLYNYFPSKDALLLAIMRRETDDAVGAAKKIVSDPPRDPADAIAAIGALYVALVSEDDRLLWRDLFAAAVASPHGLGARLFELDRRLIAQTVALIEKLKARGSLAQPMDAARAAAIVYSICLTHAMNFTMNETVTVAAMRAEIDASIRLAVNGMLAHRTRAGVAS
jgi:AcrR family transcriptional regulator